MKDKKAFRAMHGLVYADKSGRSYEYNDLLTLASGNEKLAAHIFDIIHDEYPETVVEMLLAAGEIDDNGKFLKPKRVIPCLCTICGQRNTKLSELCINGHDSWLEYRDVITNNQFYLSALRRSELTKKEFLRMFFDEKNLSMPVNMLQL